MLPVPAISAVEVGSATAVSSPKMVAPLMLTTRVPFGHSADRVDVEVVRTHATRDTSRFDSQGPSARRPGGSEQAFPAGFHRQHLF